jgi:spermidine/putrescine transport system permease protein
MAFWMLAFFLVPLILIFVYSFGYMGVYDKAVSLNFGHTDPVKGNWSVWSLHNYRSVLGSTVYMRAFMRTATMVIGNTVGCLILGYPLAYFISLKSGKRKTLYLLLVMLPFWTSFLIRTYAWITILGDQGLLNRWLQALHVINDPIQIMYTTKAVTAGLIYDYLPFMVLPLFVSIEKISRSLFEASKDLGATKWVTFRKVTLPLTVPGIVAGCMLTAIPTTGEFVIPQILGGDKVVVWGWLIYKAFMSLRDWALGSALSNILLVVMMIVVVLYAKLWANEEY